ncbi:MAG: DUF3368 domain-containing protein [Ignavibacteria bacterium]|nr:DUF3368 domain-containing protein [Ignavibacteria bacterium]
MHKTIVSDTSCFIVLDNIGELDLLKHLYGNIITTPDVANEYGKILPDWVEIKSPFDDQFQKMLELQIDKGEASAIALAVEIKDCTIILDDLKARNIAEGLNIDITGTPGVIIKAKNKKIITSIKPYLQKLKSTDFRLTPDLEILALKESGEE